MKTYAAKKQDMEAKWYLFDAEGKTLGHLAVEAANLLRGKQKPEFTPNIQCGDFVVVINAEKIKLTGKKETDKFYYRHSGYPGGFKKESVQDVRAQHPERLIERAVKGMIPPNKLRDEMIKKLKVYTGPNHPHSAQKVEVYRGMERIK